jgi:hypothetical protein
MNHLQDLKKQLRTAKAELNNSGRSKPQFLIDDDDEYQDQLELGWWKDEQRQLIEQLQKDIEVLEAVAINTPKPKYERFNLQGTQHSLNPFYKTEQEKRNIATYNALPRPDKQTCYPANYDGELDDIQPSIQNWSDLFDEHDKLRKHGR